MAAITLQNTMYKETVKKETFADRLAKYFKENAELISMGLAAINGQNPYYIYRMFHE